MLNYQRVPIPCEIQSFPTAFPVQLSFLIRHVEAPVRKVMTKGSPKGAGTLGAQRFLILMNHADIV